MMQVKNELDWVERVGRVCGPSCIDIISGAEKERHLRTVLKKDVGQGSTAEKPRGGQPIHVSEVPVVQWQI